MYSASMLASMVPAENYEGHLRAIPFLVARSKRLLQVKQVIILVINVYTGL